MAITADTLARIALDAGKLIMDIYESDFDVAHKGDASPVTAADQKAETLILAELAKADPDLLVVAEEAASEGNVPDHGPRFALVDPLDGTREFVSKNGEFTVNIAIIEHGRPVMGVVYAPARDRLFVAESHNSGWHASAKPGGAVPTDRTPLRIRRCPEAGVTAIASKSHRTPETDAWLAKHDVSETLSAGSSLKFCLIAAGEADLYPRMGRTMEWDTAAGQAVVEAAGGRVLTEDGAPLLYGKRERGYDNPHFIVYGDVTPC
ncbi:MAG: 3'(2'),5'-bisphosphate nucleotidase CysQ [Alphaproteobacteria bacterium]|nr:3'(2'),5'-bisphosphate nucleotidase CysQ [Alphaproteobacteria bacterium]MBU2084632.1 3'(2'),5'-bisphosphate nucleotidase CysQ [Alphaproteobacteria bacterium]MBU2141957.1 3'(2'),5'-bisphosphate nucleotidase CysQ [Alphaproteobacteria bacterium]MBU2198431.1 3'(2'),5'-bisphosphate nucleotidase CysQ [Alphaproteobacteria bacterium]